MREKVMSLAQGKFTYQGAEIVCSIDCLKMDVAEGGEATSVFQVSNSEKTKIKGFGAVDDFNFEFLPVFDGKENEITVKVYAANKKAGDVLKGDIHIITDCGEFTLPYEIRVVGRYLSGNEGEITSYEEFLNLAKKNFDEAVTIFYHDKFKSIYLENFDEKRLYQNLTLKNPKKQALEEFLVARGDKEVTRFGVDKEELVFDVMEEDIAGKIKVKMHGWGMVGIKVVSENSLISVDKSFLYEKDFEENQTEIDFRIRAAEVEPGIHYGKIILENVYQKIEIPVCIHGVNGQEERKKQRAKEAVVAEITHLHIKYMLNSSLRESWLRLLREKRDEILKIEEGSERLLDGYMAFLEKDEKEMTIFANSVEGMNAPTVGEKTDKVLRYLMAMYVKCRGMNSEEQRKELCEKILEYYANGYRSWYLLVMLERLGYYESNAASFIEELDRLWEEGAFSPYLHMYRMLLILQEPELLKKLDSPTISALRFGLKHDLITEEIVIAVSFLATRQRHFSAALMALLEECYEMFRNNDTLQSICTLLIRSEKLECRYFKWFRLGVEKRLRITELFEYYMYTLEKDQYDEVLPEVVSYFQYENHLRDSVKVSFYASIVRNQEKHPEAYQIYSNTIREFTLKQLYDHRISPELAVLYEKFIGVENCKDRIAKELPYILFTHRIHCANPNMERVVVAHDEGFGELAYNLINGEANINIVTPNYKLYFVDKNGFYHSGTVSYEMKKVLNLDLMPENCYENGAEHPFLLLNLFSKAIASDETSAKDAILLHMLVREQLPGVEYHEKALLALYEYYKMMEEDTLLEEIIEKINFSYLTEEKRAGVLQTMIQHKMNDLALEMQRKYEITSCSLKLLLLLITWKLEEDEGKFEPYYMRLCAFLYGRGVKNKTTLKYLSDYYMGGTEQLLKVYKEAIRQEADITDGATERILGQALFVAANPEKYFDIFLDYYEYGANRILVKAFLGYVAYEYLVGRCELTTEIREKIAKEALSEDYHVMILAMLRYYAGQEEYTDSEKEYISYHLSRYAATGRVFDFMKEFVGKMEVPFEIEHTQLIQLYCSHKKDVFVEIIDESEQKMLQPMRKVFEDIYIYETLLFRGETLHYNVFAGDMEKPVKNGVLKAEEVSEERKESLDVAFYEMVNEMIAARENEDEDTYRSLVDKYKRRQELAEKLFVPL